MWLITGDFEGFCEGEEIRVAFFLVPEAFRGNLRMDV